MKKLGSRAEVFHKNALQTKGGLFKKDLFRSIDGKIKSKKASKSAKFVNNLGGFKLPKKCGYMRILKKHSTSSEATR